jgi:hypothetical protein
MSRDLLMLTVRMGSNGPNISSFIIREFCGTPNNMVGAILLPLNKRFVNEKQIAPS